MALTPKLKKQLRDLYFDPRSPVSFRSKAKLEQAAKRLGISKEAVLKFLESQPVYTDYKPVRLRNVPSRFYNVYGKNKLLECDLLDVSSLAKHQKGQKINFLLVCVDGFSRQLFVRPLASRSSTETAKAIKSIVKENKNVMWRNVRVDQGSEFQGKFKEIVQNMGGRISFALTSVHKASLAERANLTLRQLLAKFLERRGTLQYNDKLQDIVRAHNNSKSASHGFKPGQIKGKDEFQIWSKRYLKKLPVYIPSNLKPGDTVGIFKKFGTFDKKSGRKFTREKFKVYQVFRRYNVDNIQLVDSNGKLIRGVFFPHEVSRSTAGP